MDNYPSDPYQPVPFPAPGGEQHDHHHAHHHPQHHHAQQHEQYPPVPAATQPPSPDPRGWPQQANFAAAPPAHQHGFASAPLPPSPTPPAPFAAERPRASQNLSPQPVVRVLSPVGVEYVFLTIALLTGAVALVIILVALLNGQTNSGILTFPTAALLTALPTFSWFFLRLKTMELANPNLRFDASKRRSTQFIQIISFLISFFTVITFITLIFLEVAGKYHYSIFKLTFDVIAILLVWGGTLAYYWRDEHRLI